MKAIKLNLLPYEQSRLKTHKIRIRDISQYPTEELSTLLQISKSRAAELKALVEFQSIPSIGIKFAMDLISMGYYSLEELKDKEGSKLIEALELQNGTWIDPCVEDQCRLVVHYAKHKDNSKKWWDFTEERKKYRAENGYPANRPKKAWFEVK
jgi:hypothetical protein